MIGRTQLAVVEEHLEESGEADAAPSLERIADEMQIRKVVDEIDLTVDEKNWRKCRSYFADAINVDFTSLTGGERSEIKADGLIDAWRANLFAEKKSHHMRSNHRVSIDGDRAEVFSKGYAFNLLETGEVTGLWEVWGDYKHALTRTKTGWKVSGMTLTVTHKRGDDQVRTFVPKQK